MRRILFSTLIALGATAACDRDRNENEPITTSKTVEPTRTEVDIDTERSDLRRWVDERMTRLDARIDELEKKTDDKSRETAATLRAKRDQARAKLNEMGDRTKDNWTSFKKDVQDWWDQLDRDADEAAR
jgi:hypothetical protein